MWIVNPRWFWHCITLYSGFRKTQIYYKWKCFIYDRCCTTSLVILKYRLYVLFILITKKSTEKKNNKYTAKKLLLKVFVHKFKYIHYKMFYWEYVFVFNLQVFIAIFLLTDEWLLLKSCQELCKRTIQF